jgi:hypothetical protein
MFVLFMQSERIKWIIEGMERSCLSARMDSVLPCNDLGHETLLISDIQKLEIEEFVGCLL